MFDYIMNPAPERKIVWIWDSVGNEGKTAFAKWMTDSYQNEMLLMELGKKVDMLYMVHNHHRVFFINIPRSS